MSSMIKEMNILASFVTYLAR